MALDQYRLDAKHLIGGHLVWRLPQTFCFCQYILRGVAGQLPGLIRLETFFRMEAADFIRILRACLSKWR